MERGMNDVGVLVVDLRSGEVEARQVSVGRREEVSYLVNELLEIYPGTDIQLKNQGLRLDENERLSDVLKMMDPEDQLTALVRERMWGVDQVDMKRDRVQNISSCKVVIQDKKGNNPFFLDPEDLTNSLTFKKNWFTSKELNEYELDEVGRKREVKIDGEPVFSGYSYDLPKDDNIETFKISDSSMLKVMKSGEVEEIPSKGEPIKVKEGDFYKPTPDEIYYLSILNKTGDPVEIVTGRDSSFEIVNLPPALGNKGLLVPVKPSSKNEYKIGLITKKSADAAGYLTYTVDAYRLKERVKKLEIQPDKKVIITMAGGERQDMVREKEDTYKEADKNFLYKLKGKVAKQPTLTEADLDFLKANTGMTREEIKGWFQGFLKDFPAGELNRDQYVKMGVKLFPNTDTTVLTNELFNVFDTDNSGTINFRELQLSMVFNLKGSPQEKLNWAFKMFDHDGDGMISIDEMTRIKNLMIHFLMTIKGVDKGKAEALFQDMDKDKDGMVSKEEFIAAYCSKNT